MMNSVTWYGSPLLFVAFIRSEIVTSLHKSLVHCNIQEAMVDDAGFNSVIFNPMHLINAV